MRRLISRFLSVFISVCFLLSLLAPRMLNGSLKVRHCNDANCTGGNESIEMADTGREVGWFSSLVIDSLGTRPAVGHDWSLWRSESHGGAVHVQPTAEDVDV
jgi:hypothetical protein